MILRARQLELVFPRPALVMGIVNVTPDSFSDGGHYFEPAAALAHAEALAGAGANILDIGGESTRPGAEPVSEEEELRRVLPVLKGLAGRTSAWLSIDTQKPAVAEAAIAWGARMVNNVAAGRADPLMTDLVARSGVAYVLMHMQGTPLTMQQQPVYAKVVDEVNGFFREHLIALQQRGVAAEQIILDVGIGFGKSLEHNLQLLAHMKCFSGHGRPLMLGVSRKSFLGKLDRADVTERLPAALACTCLARQAPVHLFRTHDVTGTLRALRMTEAIMAHQS